MEQIDSGPSVPVYCLKPPYVEFEEVPQPEALTSDALPLGSLLALEISDGVSWDVVAREVPRLRARCPAAPVVLRVRRGVAGDHAELARRSGELHVRALLYE